MDAPGMLQLRNSDHPTLATARKIRYAIIGCSLVASLLLVLAVPKEAHRHFGGRTNHIHSPSTLSEVGLAHSPIVDSKRNDLQSGPFAKGVPSFNDDQAPSRSNEIQRELARWRQMDVSLDELRDEIVFGELESQTASPSQIASGDTVSSNVSHKIPAHDESVPHVHYVLLGFEFTMNLPSNRQVAVENVLLTEDSKQIQILPRNELAVQNTVVDVELLSGPTSVKVKLSFPNWLHSHTVLSKSNRPPFAFEQPQDQHAQSLDQQVDSPPPRLS